MSIGSQSCPHCNASYAARAEGGAKAKCPSCGKALTAEAAIEWYYSRGDLRVGPLSAAQMRELAVAGLLLPTDMVERSGKKKAVPAREVKGLFPEMTAVATSPRKVLGPLTVHRAPRPVPYELIATVVAIAGITVAYMTLAKRGLMSPSGPLGHGLGVVGFLLMLCTETLYSLRKRLVGFHFGRMSVWLQVHIFTGFVGSYMVLLHSAGKFNGLAGVLSLITVVMVLSGIVGRYIHTAVPRTADGAEVAAQELEDQILESDRQLQALGINLLTNSALAAATAEPRGGWGLVFLRPLLRWRQKRRLHRALQKLNAVDRAHARELEQLLVERYRIQLQVHSLPATRRLLALWHTLHVPLGVTLFALAFIHIGAALYYATLLK
jgi:hypothetical protein